MSEQNIKGLLKKAGIGAAVVLLLAVGSCSTDMVDEGEEAVVLRMGNYHRIHSAGMNMKMPFFETSHTFDLRQRTLELDKEVIQLRDEQPLYIDTTLYWRIKDMRSGDVYRQFRSEEALSDAISGMFRSTLKVAFGRHVSNTVIQKREEVEGQVQQMVKERLEKAYPFIEVKSVQLESVRFSEQVQKAAEANARTKTEILTAQTQAKKAEEEARRTEIEASAAAKRKIIEAEAEAKAAELRAQALQKSPQLVALMEAEAKLKLAEAEIIRANKWNGQMPQTLFSGSGQMPTPLVQVK